MEGPFNCRPKCLHWRARVDSKVPWAPRICWLSNKTRRIKLFQIYRDKGVLPCRILACVYVCVCVELYILSFLAAGSSLPTSDFQPCESCKSKIIHPDATTKARHKNY